MKNNILNEQIEQLGIYELRTLARNMGVSSPTTKRRDVLISEIKEIKAGKKKPNFNNKLGRPVKVHTSQDSLLTKIMVSDAELEAKINQSMPKNTSNALVFAQNLGKDADVPVNYILINVSGVVRKTDNGTFYVLNYSKISQTIYIMIDEDDVINNKIIEGDYIVGYAYYNARQNFGKVKSFETINGENPAYNKYNFDTDLIIPNRVLEKPNFKYGQCKLEKTKGIDDALEFISKKVKEFRALNIKCMAVALASSIETKLKLDRIPGLINIVSTYEDTASLGKEKLVDSYSLANSLMYHNKDVVVFVLNVMGIYDVLNIANNQSNEEVEFLIRKTLAQCKATQNGSISVYGLYYENQEEEYAQQIRNLIKITQN